MNHKGLKEQALKEGIKPKSLYQRNWARKNKDRVNADKRAKYISKKKSVDWVLETINKMR